MKKLFKLATLAAVGYAVWNWFQTNQRSEVDVWSTDDDQPMDLR